MADSEDDAKIGGCMCGAVRYEVSGAARRVVSCHCHSCRHHTGAPMATLAVFGVEQVRFLGTPRKIYGSAPGVGRAFCPDCGTTLTWETSLGDDGRICAIHVSTFDDPEAFPPGAHSFYGERISWFDAADELARYEGFVAHAKLLGYGPCGDATQP